MLNAKGKKSISQLVGTVTTISPVIHLQSGATESPNQDDPQRSILVVVNDLSKSYASIEVGVTYTFSNLKLVTLREESSLPEVAADSSLMQKQYLDKLEAYYSFGLQMSLFPSIPRSITTFLDASTAKKHFNLSSVYQREICLHSEVHIEATVLHVERDGWLDLETSLCEPEPNMAFASGGKPLAFYHQPLRFFLYHRHPPPLEMRLDRGTVFRAWCVLPVFLWGALCGFTATVRTHMVVIVPTPVAASASAPEAKLESKLESESTSSLPMAAPRPNVGTTCDSVTLHRERGRDVNGTTREHMNLKPPSEVRMRCVTYSAWRACVGWDLLQSMQAPSEQHEKPVSVRATRAALEARLDLDSLSLPQRLPPVHTQFYDRHVSALVLVCSGHDNDWLWSQLPQVIGVMQVKEIADRVWKQIRRRSAESHIKNDATVVIGGSSGVKHSGYSVDNVGDSVASSSPGSQADGRYCVEVTHIREYVHQHRDNSPISGISETDHDVYVSGAVREILWGERLAMISLHESESSHCGNALMILAVLCDGVEDWAALGLTDEVRSDVSAVCLRDPVLLLEHCPLVRTMASDKHSGKRIRTSLQDKQSDRGGIRPTPPPSPALTLVAYLAEARDIVCTCTHSSRRSKLGHKADSDMSGPSPGPTLLDGSSSTSNPSRTSEGVGGRLRPWSVRELLQTDFQSQVGKDKRKLSLEAAIEGVVICKTLLPRDGTFPGASAWYESEMGTSTNFKRARDDSSCRLERSRCSIVLRDSIYEDEVLLYLPYSVSLAVRLGSVVRIDAARYCVSTTSRKLTVYLSFIEQVSKIGISGMVSLTELPAILQQSQGNKCGYGNRVLLANRPCPSTDLFALWQSRTCNRAQWRVRCQITAVKSLSVALRCSMCLGRVECTPYQSAASLGQRQWVCVGKCVENMYKSSAPIPVWQASLAIDDGTSTAVAFIDGEDNVKRLLVLGEERPLPRRWSRFFDFISSAVLRLGYVRYRYMSASGSTDWESCMLDTDDAEDADTGVAGTGEDRDSTWGWERCRGVLSESDLALRAVLEAVRRISKATPMELTVCIRMQKAEDKSGKCVGASLGEPVLRTVRVQVADGCDWQVRRVDIPTLGAPPMFLDVLHLKALDSVDMKAAIRESLNAAVGDCSGATCEST